jgi:hypothetical protein
MESKPSSLTHDLEDFRAFSDDVARATYANFQNSLQRLVALLEPSRELGQLAARFLPAVDFESWYEEALATQRGLVGSGRLNWPVSNGERVALQLELLKRLADGSISIADFTDEFTRVSKYFDSNVRAFGQQVFLPGSSGILVGRV